VLAFSTRENESKWTKKNVLNLLIDSEKQYSPQIEATTIFVRNVPESKSFIDSWRLLCEINHFTFLNDDLGDESKIFVEHRHDQSIFSILYKNKDWQGLTNHRPNGPDEVSKFPYFERISLSAWPIWPIRNRSGISRLGSIEANAGIAIWGNLLLHLRPFSHIIHRFLIKAKYYVRNRVTKLSINKGE
jgi:hypothetical protein